jgi:zinc transport system permease protein
MQSSFLWRNPIIVASVAAFILALVGIYVVLPRLVFVTACLANVSGVGVAIGLLLGLGVGEHAAHGEHSGVFDDLLGVFGFSLVITCLTAAGFAWWRESKRISGESLLGVAYLLSSALLVLLSSQLNHATHDIDDIVFGSAVVVEPSQLVIVPFIAALLLILHLLLRKDFLFVSFDPVMARAIRYPVRALDILLFISVGLAIAIATRALGALPVFAFIVLPPLAALQLTERISLVFVLAPIFGVLSAAGGYFAAFMLAWPVGPTMTVLGVCILALSALRPLLSRRA